MRLVTSLVTGCFWIFDEVKKIISKGFFLIATKVFFPMHLSVGPGTRPSTTTARWSSPKERASSPKEAAAVSSCLSREKDIWLYCFCWLIELGPNIIYDIYVFTCNFQVSWDKSRSWENIITINISANPQEKPSKRWKNVRKSDLISRFFKCGWHSKESIQSTLNFRELLYINIWFIKWNAPHNPFLCRVKSWPLVTLPTQGAKSQEAVSQWEEADD